MPGVPEETPNPTVKNKQVEHAERLLEGAVDLGPKTRNFMETIRRDATFRSTRQNNRYLQEFYQNRPQNIVAPQRHISLYSTETVEKNALLEFKLDFWKPVKLTSVNITEYSMAILKLLSEADDLFCWTAELLRRTEYRRDEEILKDRIDTYLHLLSYLSLIHI